LGGNSWAGMVQFVSIYGVWFVAGLIALESVGVPVPAEAALIAAAFFGAGTHELDICLLIAAGILAAIVGEIVGFWIGKLFGRRVLVRYGPLQWLFVKYGVRFVFVARFLPVLRNMAAVLAGTNCMPQHHFYFASSAAAVAWVTCYGLGAYSFGEAFAQFASWAAFALGCAALLIVIAMPLLIARYEKRALAKAAGEIAHSEMRARRADNSIAAPPKIAATS
jgi:membrane protein DedA with SNARE-associated domain